MEAGKVGPKIDTVQLRAGIVENPDLIRSSLKRMIDGNEKQITNYIQNVERYAEDVADRFVWMRGGGKPGPETNAATKTTNFARKHPFRTSHNAASTIHSKRVKRH